jgi:hypothetical protein
MARFHILVAFLIATFDCAHGQWEILEAHTTASLLGIESISNGVAWASGILVVHLLWLALGVFWCPLDARETRVERVAYTGAALGNCGGGELVAVPSDSDGTVF